MAGDLVDRLADLGRRDLLLLDLALGDLDGEDYALRLAEQVSVSQKNDWSDPTSSEVSDWGSRFRCRPLTHALSLTR